MIAFELSGLSEYFEHDSHSDVVEFHKTYVLFGLKLASKHVVTYSRTRIGYSKIV